MKKKYISPKINTIALEFSQIILTGSIIGVDPETPHDGIDPEAQEDLDLEFGY